MKIFEMIKLINLKRIASVFILANIFFFTTGSELFAQVYSYARPGRTDIIQRLLEKNPNHDHPRLYARAADFAILRQKIVSDPQMVSWYAKFLANADKYVNWDTIPPNYLSIVVIQNGYLTSDYTRSFPERMSALSLAFQITGQQKYADRAYKEMMALVSIPDWTSTKYGYHLNTADIMWGFAVVYDWCYDAFTPAQRTILRNDMVNKGINKLLAMYNANPTYKINPTIGNPFSDGNHNPWDNGGASAAALAIGDEVPAVAGELLERALVVAENFTISYGTYGFTEGPGYGNGALSHYMEWMAAMESALGTSYNYFNAPGMTDLAYFSPYNNGPVKSLNYHDAGTDSKKYLDATFFIANKILNPALGNMHKTDLDNGNTLPIVKDLLWYKPDYYGTSTEMLVLDKYFAGNVHTGSFRSSFSDPNALFLAFHGGENRVGHRHFDTGQFNIDAMGMNWALDLGSEPLTYNAQLLSTSGANVKLLYRIATQGHNTLLVNPNNTFPGQSEPAFSPVTKFVSEESGGFSIMDMTAAYSTQASSAKRGYALTGNRSRIIIQDEITLSEQSTVWWNMNTRASIEVSKDGKTAILSQSGKRLRACLISPHDGSFLAMKAVALPESYSNYAETPNLSIQRLSIKLEGVNSTTIMVEFTPINNETDLNLPTLPLIPLGSWSEPRATINIAPNIKYKDNQLVFEINKAITPIIPLNTGGVVPVASGSGYMITPRILPDGLVFNNYTGEISGTPTTLTPPANYTVNAINPFGNSLTMISIQVVSVLPPEFLYPKEETYFSTGKPIDPITPQNFGGSVVVGGLSISPTLPNGLNFDGITGTISGTPIESRPMREYTILAHNDGGTSQSVVKIGTLKIIPPVISYLQDAYLFSPQKLIKPIIPINKGGEVPATIFGTVNSAATGANWPQGMTVNHNDNKLYISARGAYRVLTMTLPSSSLNALAGSGVNGSADGQGTLASFSMPSGIAIHPQTGYIYVADVNNNSIRKISPTGAVSTYAGTAVAGNVDGAISTATFNQPQGLCFDSDGSLYVLQYGNPAIRKINSTGTQVTTISKLVRGNSAFFTYANGNFYVSELSGNTIDKVNLSDGSLTVLAGSAASVAGFEDGLGSDAKFNAPRGMAIDSTGNIYVADYSNHAIRRITPAGYVTTVAGNGVNADKDGVGSNASFRNPASIALDGLGNLYVGDAGSQKIRKVILTGYSITPELPVGMNFDKSTGVISGTPSEMTLVKDYTITAFNANGNSSSTIKIGVAYISDIQSTKLEIDLFKAYLISDRQIEILGNVSQKTIASLYDLQGKLLLNQSLNYGNKNWISIPNLMRGMYLLRIYSNDGVKTIKIMINS